MRYDISKMKIVYIIDAGLVTKGTIRVFFCVNLPKTGYLFCYFFCTFAVCNEYLAK